MQIVTKIMADIANIFIILHFLCCSVCSLGSLSDFSDSLFTFSALFILLLKFVFKSPFSIMQ